MERNLMENKIDSLILGDNQFFGVNHISEDKGRVAYEKFKDLSEIKKVMYCALDYGVGGIMFSTHPSIYQIAEMMRKDNALRNGFSLYICVPYILKYVRMVSTMGFYNTVKAVLEGKSIIDKTKYFLNVGYNIITSDYLGIANRLIDAEINPFHDLNVKAVFLHNVLTDLSLGYGMINVVKNFDEYIKRKYGVIPGFITFNYPQLCNLLSKANINHSLVMTSVNKKGFLMSPSRGACEEAMRNYPHIVIAMATLACGAISPQEAYEYLFSKNNIKHVIVGLSSKKHADETFGILRRYLNL
jgi:hypothetical protein